MTEFSIVGNNISFEITVDGETALMQQDGGAWYLTFPADYPKGGTRNLTGTKNIIKAIEAAFWECHARATNAAIKARQP